jgi:aryl-alcohol dehydrogenase-like predicted oxidoreductase
MVDAAIEAGINFFDTADIYGKTERGVSGQSSGEPAQRRPSSHEIRHENG